MGNINNKLLPFNRIMKQMNFNNLVDDYDPISGFYFKSITEEKKETSRFSKNSPKVIVKNIGIFNPSTDEIFTVFPVEEDVIVNKLLFEIGYKKSSLSIEYNDNSFHKIRNNSNIEKRNLNSKLLISTLCDVGCTLWVSDKDGKNLNKITTVSDKDSWHLDVKNSKIRVVSSTEGKLYIQSFAW